MYILAALGFAFIFNMLGTINLAHGALYMVGAYLCYYLCAMAGMNKLAGARCGCLLCWPLSAYCWSGFMFRPFMADFDRIIMIGVALMTIGQTIANVLTGSQALVIPAYATGSVSLLGVPISNERLLTFGIGAGPVAHHFIYRQSYSLGTSDGSCGPGPAGGRVARNQYQPSVRYGMCHWVRLAAVAGCFMGAYQGLSANMGDTMNLRILMLVMLAGAGSMNGIIITGTVMGFLDCVCPILFQGNAGSAVPIAIVVILLLIKPKGFFGHEMA